MVSLIGGEALMPNPALKPFDAFIGVWQTTGTHPYLSGKTLHGRTSFAWHEGGAFVIMRSEIDEPEIPSGVAIFGSDDEAGTYFMIYFDERGVSRKYDVTFTRDRLTWHRDEPSFSQRFTITIEGGGDRMTARVRCPGTVLRGRTISRSTTSESSERACSTRSPQDRL